MFNDLFGNVHTSVVQSWGQMKKHTWFLEAVYVFIREEE